MQPIVTPSSHTNNIPQHHPPSLHPIHALDLPLSFFDRSEPNFQYMAYSGAFQASADRSQDLFNLECETERRDYFVMLKAHNSSKQTEQDHLYSVLSFRRGFSEQYELGSSRREEHAKEEVLVSCQQLQERRMPLQQRRMENNQFIHTTQENQSIKSADLQNNKPTQQSKTEESTHKEEEKKVSTKNVTKNMGKILFKWIWANRRTLQSQLPAHSHHWQQFVSCLKQWKKENNITRRFLSQKWHSSHPTSQLFRIVSAHFFRTKCIASIYISNIKDKQIHTKRIRRFLEGVSDSCALDSLN